MDTREASREAVAHPRSSQLAATSSRQRLATNSRLLLPRLPRCAARATKAHLVHLGQRERRERTAKTARTERTERTERTPRHCPHHTKSRASCARPAHPDHKAQLDPKDRLDRRDRPESRHVMEFPASRECKASLDQSDVPAAKVRAEHPASLVVLSPCPDRKDQLARPDRPESKDPRDSLAPMGSHSKAHPDRLAMPANLDVRDAPVALALLDRLARMARRAAATTAPSHAHRRATLPRPATTEAAAPATTSTDERGRHSVCLLCAASTIIRCGISIAGIRQKQRSKYKKKHLVVQF